MTRQPPRPPSGGAYPPDPASAYPRGTVPGRSSVYGDPVYRPPYLPGQEPIPPRDRRPRSSPVLAPLLALVGLLFVGGASVWAVSFLGVDLTRVGAEASEAPSPGVLQSPGPGIVAAASLEPVVVAPEPTVLPDIAEPPPDDRATVKGSILFSRAGDIWSASGQELRRLTEPDSTKSDGSPAWSPDGRSIYFIRTSKRPTANSREGGLYTLYVTDVWRMKADGSGREKVYDALIKAPAGTWFSHVLQPDVSPNGGSLAVVSDGPDGSGPVELHLLENRGKRLAKVAAPGEGDLGHNDPDWSPDGSRIAFTFNHSQGTDGVPRIGIFQCKSRKDCTSGKTKLLRLGYARPSWSPDGQWLAVEATRGAGRDIAIIDPARGDVRVLLTDDGNSFAPSVSPEGDQIAYLHRDGIDIDLRVMTLDIASDGKITLVDDRAITDDGSIDGDSRPSWYVPGDQRATSADGAGAEDDGAAAPDDGTTAPAEGTGASEDGGGAPPPP